MFEFENGSALISILIVSSSLVQKTTPGFVLGAGTDWGGRSGHRRHADPSG